MLIIPDRSSRAPARLLITALLIGSVAGGTSLAQTAPATPPAASSGGPSGSVTLPPPADPVVATVNGQPIHLSEVNAAVAGLPPQARAMPREQLYPMLLQQQIDGHALLIQAQKSGLDKDPAVQRSMQAASDRALESALVSRAVAPQVTEDAVKARYDQQVAGQKGDVEVHARHILVTDEATAKKIIADLKKGGDFAALSKQYSKDPGASQQGGDLGFFKKTDMVPEFSTVAFSLKDGEISPTPVHSQFGWHVIQVLEHRTVPPPSFEDSRDQIRQSIIQAAVQKEIADALSGVKIERFNQDGSPMRATDSAEPPPASPK